jgi:DNA-binding CsgD family transcriptional regulator
MGEAAAPGTRKYLVVADMVRARIRDGSLRPGDAAPGGEELSRATGYSTLTCLRGLRYLAGAGALTRRAGGQGQFRVPLVAADPAVRVLVAAGDALSAGLAARRRAAGMSQPDLAGLTCVSLTAVRHAETGLLWQAPDFWERADSALGAGGGLLRLHHAYLLAKACAPSRSAGLLGTALTPREREVAVLYARRRMTAAEIAGELGIAEGTVRGHLARVHAKAGTGGVREGARLRLAAWMRRQEPQAAAAGGR